VSRESNAPSGCFDVFVNPGAADADLPFVILEVRPSRDVHTVVIGRGERPPFRCMGFGNPPAGGNGRLHPRFCLVGRHTDVDMGAAASPLGRTEFMKPKVGVASVRVDRILLPQAGPCSRVPRSKTA
jgi:hypothetical protein